jgi:sterol 14-demethylase
MLQLKAIYAILFRRYKFELVNPPESYQDDYKQMVVQPGSPCLVRYTKRDNIEQSATKTTTEATNQQTATPSNCFKVEVDYDLCQGHANCMAEASEVFQVDDKGILTVLQETPDNALLKKAQAAAKYCPTGAIKIKQD